MSRPTPRPVRNNDCVDMKYVCPQTHAPLRLGDGTLRDATGKFVYPIKGGIPQFLCFEPIEDDHMKGRLAQLNRLARGSGWQAALRAVYGDDPSFLRYVTDAGRASFVDLLPLTRDSEVLEIGPGLGQFTGILANRTRSVHGLEVVAEQAEFAAERCRQTGATNAHLAAGGDDCRLPYSHETFDVVVLNLVFEWCASRCPGEPEDSVQRRLLAEIYRVLRRGGSLYLATKNRFALRNILGKPDEHCHGMRFGSALPRGLVQCMLRLSGHARPLGRLYSYNALIAMLRDAGFGQIDSFWAAPEMRYPTHYVPIDATSVREACNKAGFIQGELRSTRIIMRMIPAALVKYFTPGLAFLASKRR